ncbi:helicase [Salmonella enterica]|nr:helicase [Salmonella enterica]
MSKKNEGLHDDNWQRGPHDNSSPNSLSGDNPAASERQGADDAGPENSGPMGNQSTQRPQSSGETGVPDAVFDSHQSAGNGNGRADRESRPEHERAGNAGTPGSQHKPANFRLNAITDLGAGGAKTKFKDNIASLELLKELESNKRQASPDEQAILARYVGWGGIPQAFDETNSDWENEYKRLRDLLSPDEYDSARASTLNAHYTSSDVITGIYNGLQKIGVGDGVRILEPASGIGHFAGMLPFQADMTLNELDSISSRISRQLYPEFTTIHQGFEKFRAPANYFDVAIGNPPFGDFRVNDPLNPQTSRFSIHNFFLAKSLDSVRAGGITAMVVSRFFLDSKSSEHREYIADRAHFLGAIRLPENAFKQNALTTVTTDIVFFQKAHPGEETERSWIDTGFVRCASTNEPIEVNSWFVNHPEQMIGQMQLESRAFGNSPQCVAAPGLNLNTEISSRLSPLPKNCFIAKQHNDELNTAAPKPSVDFTDTGVKVDSFFITPDNRIAVRKPDLLGKGDYEYYITRSAVEDERIRSAIQIRDTLTHLIALETNDNTSQSTMDQVRQSLNLLYDKHVKKYDFLSSRSNKSVLKYDPLYPLLQSLEVEYDKGITKTMAEKEGSVQRKPSARKAAIFSRRVNRPSSIASSAGSAKDGLVISLNETGRVDIDRISALTGMPPEAVTRELRGLIYRNPESLEYDIADTFLSGNVKKKLEKARRLYGAIPSVTADELDKFTHKYFSPDAAARFKNIDTEILLDELQRSISALEKNQPQDIDAIDISVQLISTWLPQTDIQAFVREHLGIADQECKAVYVPPVGKWVTSFKGGNKDLLENTWGTARMNALEILDRLFNNTAIQVRDITGFNDDGSPIYTVNQEETLAAQGKAEQIANEFTDWIWRDAERRERLARRYNDRFNTHVPASYDGSHLVLPQASGDIKLRGTQKNAIWRGIQEGGGLGDHVVGAGKTLTAIATIMEQRRMQLLNKPLVAVPNHLLGQWKDEFYKLYPGANVLVAEQADFEKDNRKRLFATIATGDFDAVIIGHSSFKFLSLAPEDEIAFLSEQVSDITASLDEYRQSLGKRDPSVKEMEKQKKRLEEKIAKISDSGKKDDLLTFDQLGVDALFIDEADEFKNLAIVTSQTRIAGLGNLQGSEKAMDLFLKCRWLQKKRDGKGVYFYTGTPISNSLAELYTLQRYMQYDELKDKHIAAFDSWASTFGQVVNGWELDATGVNYRLNARFAKFTNVPELMRMYRSFADVVTQEDLAAQARADGTGRLVPKLKGGKPTSVVVPRSKLQAQYMGEMETVIDPFTGRPALDNLGREVKEWTPGSIIHRMENMPKDPRIDNALKVTHDARIAALDFRLVNPHAPDDQGSKVNEAVRRIHSIWDANTYRKGTQLVFCDLSTPKGKFTANTAAANEPTNDDSFSMDEILGESIDPEKFSVYADIKQKLIDKGVPANEIKFIHDATNDQKRQELFRAVNNGDVRILIGSTSKMGAGTNVQRRLVALHDLDCPWRPRDLEQRHGRGIRQGNMFFEQDKENFELEICCYATERTYDARMWQTIEVKARGIEQFRNGSLTDRVIEDIAGDAANAAEMKASATGNQLIFQQVKIDSEKRKQETLYRNWQRSRHSLESRVAQIPKDILQLTELIPGIRDDVAYINQHADTAGLQTQATSFIWRKTEGVKIEDNAVEKLEIYLKDRMRKAVDNMAIDIREPVFVGNYRGMAISVKAGTNAKGLYTSFTIGRTDGHSISVNNMDIRYSSGDSFSPTGLFVRIDNLLNDASAEITRCEANIQRLQRDLEIAKQSLEGDYPQKQYLDALRQDAIDVMVELKKMQDDDDYVSTWKSRSEEIAPGTQIKISSSENEPQEELTVEKESNTEAPISTAESAPDLSSQNVQESISTVPEKVLPREDASPEQTSLIGNNADTPDTELTGQRQNSTDLVVPFKFGEVIYNTEMERLQIKFSDKPEKGSEAHRLMRMLSERGRFAYAPTQNKCWVRRLNDKSVIAAANILQVELPLVSRLEIETTSHDLEIPAAVEPVRLTSEELASMELTANELFSRYNEGDCSAVRIFTTTRELAEAGSAEGMYLLSFCYFDGIGTEADASKAVELLHQAAGTGHQEACYRVAELYETGEYDHALDLNQALRFYQKSDPSYSSNAIERVNKRIEKTKLSSRNGFQDLLNQHKDHPESAEKFYSRMNLLYDRIIEAQSSKETLSAELQLIGKSDVSFIEIGSDKFDLNNTTDTERNKLNSNIMSFIKEAVCQRKEAGKPVELDVGKFAGLRIRVRSVENELRFSLTGNSTWSPDSLVYKKGEREKFKLSEFLDTLETFPTDLHERLSLCEVRINELEEQSKAEQSKYDSLNNSNNQKVKSGTDTPTTVSNKATTHSRSMKL